MSASSYGLFEVFGIELEYMIVDRDSLAVRPLADELIRDESGAIRSEIERGEIAWSNELALHVIEMKTNGPAPALHGLAGRFQANVARCGELLAPRGARLMPTSMHPWMDPLADLTLWPHEHNAVYESFNRIFDCRGHGWANLQSMHINLPFADDEEFGRLHAAIRLLLPVLPALAASSPIADGAITGLLDTRMEVYRGNSRRVPSVAGAVVPEPAWSRAEYEERILQPIYAALAPLDPEGILQFEWANARGCIARFDRNAIEIRVLDLQEAPAADLAVAAAIVAVLRGLVDGAGPDQARQRGFDTGRLAAVFRDVIRSADETPLTDGEYLAALGLPGGRATAGELWDHLIDTHLPAGPGAREWDEPLRVIRRQGPLARRILRAVGGDTRRERLREVYRELCACLDDGRMFHG